MRNKLPREAIVCTVLALMLLALPVHAQGQPQSSPAPTPSPTPALAPDPMPLTVKGKAVVFAKRIVGPSSLSKSAIAAGIAQYKDSPEEWGQGVRGYLHRYGSKMANRGVENGIGFVVASLLHEDPRYFPSQESGLWPRTRHAIAESFMTRTDSGGREISVWRFAGNYGAQFISNAWRPEPDAHVGDALARGTISIGYDAASTLFKEFWPDIKKRVFRRR